MDYQPNRLEYWIHSFHLQKVLRASVFSCLPIFLLLVASSKLKPSISAICWQQCFCLNHTQLNMSKTEITKFGTPKQLKAVENLNSTYNISFNSSLKTSGVFFVSKLIFKNHINFTKTCTSFLTSMIFSLMKWPSTWFNA